MKLTFKDIEPFVKKPDTKARVVLVYGPDAGLVKERAAAMGKTVVTDLNDPFNVATLTADQITDDPARLMDEAMALSMMGGARLIRIDDGSDKITVTIKDYLAHPSAENLVIIQAGELGPKSTLRALVEKVPNAAAVPCYVDDDRAVSALVRQTLSAAGYNIQPDALSWFASNIAGDRARVRAEIDKLMIYAGQTKTLTIDDVRAACGEAGDQSMDDLLFVLGSGRIDEALRAYNKLLEEGTYVVPIIRSLYNHVRRLHYTKSLMQGGMGAGEAMKKLQPAIFFKNEDAFKAQLSKWSADRLLSMMMRLNEIEAQMKKTGTPAETLGAHAVLSLAA